MNEELYKKLYKEAWDSPRIQVENEVKDKVENEVGIKIENRVWHPIWNRTKNQVRDHIRFND